MPFLEPGALRCQIYFCQENVLLLLLQCLLDQFGVLVILHPPLGKCRWTWTFLWKSDWGWIVDGWVEVRVARGCVQPLCPWVTLKNNCVLSPRHPVTVTTAQCGFWEWLEPCLLYPLTAGGELAKLQVLVQARGAQIICFFLLSSGLSPLYVTLSCLLTLWSGIVFNGSKGHHSMGLELSHWKCYLQDTGLPLKVLTSNFMNIAACVLSMVCRHKNVLRLTQVLYSVVNLV